MADTLLKCTTRHVRLFTAAIQDEDLIPSDDQLTLDLDPDNEFLWDAAAGGELSDYTLRRIGTDLEGFIRQLLQAGELSYNPDGRVQNFSMGLPRTPELL